VTSGRSIGQPPPCIPKFVVLRYMVAALNIYDGVCNVITKVVSAVASKFRGTTVWWQRWLPNRRH